ncbi:MAG: response regulator [Rhodospirillales bacterium]|jgi:two-component system KDP operon response regulator KdpE|nr:response regulator [Rhodospirillales bacterium]
MPINGNARILVVDDEPQIRRFLSASLNSHEYTVIEAHTGNDAIRLCTTAQPDLVILDLGLPDIDGREVLTRIREWSRVPIIVLSVRFDEQDKIDALDRGADDYVTKPFGMGELLARMRTALRHRVGTSEEAPLFSTGGLAVDLTRRVVTVDGEEVRLSRKEYEVLRTLVKHAGKVVTHQQLLREVWGPAHVNETQYLRVYVGQLRQKIERDPTQPRYIITEAGVGYRLRQLDDDDQ